MRKSAGKKWSFTSRLSRSSELTQIDGLRLPINTGVGSGGYAEDLTPPTIYVEGILICISPLEKT